MFGLAGLAGSAASAALAAREAKKNRKFQKKMYQNRFQYSVRDMKKAGINPIAAAGMGLGGGGSPSGSMASMPDMGSAASTAVQSSKVGSENIKRKSETRLINKQMEMLQAQIHGERARVGETAAKTQNLMANTLLAINNKERWQPLADMGAAASEGTGPARNFIKSMKTPNFRQNMKNLFMAPYEGNSAKEFYEPRLNKGRNTKGKR